MKSTLFLFSFLLFCGTSIAQKKEYSKEELQSLNEYYFNEGFVNPSTKKVSTINLKDGTEIRGYVQRVRTKKFQIRSIILKDSVSQDKLDLDASYIAEAYLFGSEFDKHFKMIDQVERAGTGQRKSMRKIIASDEIYFVNKSVSLKNKKENQEFLLQLINPDFDRYIAVYYDPAARETSGANLGGLKLGGGVIQSYYIEKGDRVLWLRKKDFKKHYEFLFGDNPEFMEQYPVKSAKWEWLSALILEYSKMQSAT